MATQQRRRRRKPTRAEIRKKKRQAVYLKIHKFFVSISVFFLISLVAYHVFIPSSTREIPPPVTHLTGEHIEEGSSHYTRKAGFYNFLLIGSDDGHGNADTIMVVSYDSIGEKLNLISIPRDTLVYRTWSNFPKLNAGMSQGIETLKEEVSYTLGIPIDFHVQIGLDAFVDVVDELGGIDFYVPEDMYHDDEGGFIIDLQEGQQWLDGRHTLELVRYRGYVTADIGRTETQQEVLKVLTQKLISWKSFTKIEAFLNIFQEHVTTDISSSDFLWFAKNVLADSELEIHTETLSGRGDGVYGSYRWCYELDSENTLSTVNQYLNPYEIPRTLEDMILVSADNYNS